MGAHSQGATGAASNWGNGRCYDGTSTRRRHVGWLNCGRSAALESWNFGPEMLTSVGSWPVVPTYLGLADNRVSWWIHGGEGRGEGGGGLGSGTSGWELDVLERDK